MATSDPYQNWSGAPKHWVHVPEQRQGSPGPEQLEAAQQCWAASGRDSSRQFGEWTVAAVALAVAVAAFVLIGTGGAVADGDAPPSDRTSGTLIR